MKTYNNLYSQLISYENLEKAFKKARIGKSSKPYVIEFEKNLKENLTSLRNELENFTYIPKPLKRFTIRDPKTRIIHASAFRDRVVHHALCNIIDSIFDKTFIYDSYANRKGKSVHCAIKRFDYFKRKISINGSQLNNTNYKNMVIGYVLKADIKHYFDTIDHAILIKKINRTIKDKNVIGLIKQILNQYYFQFEGKGMPLGNLTSQFFANVYLNDLDYFVKHKLKAKYYMRYVDDFVILHNSKEVLIEYKDKINKYLNNLKLELHPNKSKIIPLYKGINFLGFNVFYYHKLLKKSNIRRFKRKLHHRSIELAVGDLNYDDFINGMQGWLGYAMWANTHNLRKTIAEKIKD